MAFTNRERIASWSTLITALDHQDPGRVTEHPMDRAVVWAVRCAAALGRPLTRSCLSETANREMPTELDKSFDKSCRSANAEDDQGRAAAFRSRDWTSGLALLVPPGAPRGRFRGYGVPTLPRW